MSYPDFLLERGKTMHWERIESYEECDYHLTDLCYCQQKRVFKLQYQGAWQLKPYMIMGDIVEKGIQHLLEGEKEFFANPRRKKSIDGVIISGETDLLFEDKVVDVKSPKKMYENKVHEQYKRQIRLEMWLFEKPKGEVWYATKNWLGKKEVNIPFKTAQVKELIEEDTKPLYPEWECAYCQWKGFCPYAVIKK